MYDDIMELLNALEANLEVKKMPSELEFFVKSNMKWARVVEGRVFVGNVAVPGSLEDPLTFIQNYRRLMNTQLREKWALKACLDVAAGACEEVNVKIVEDCLHVNGVKLNSGTTLGSALGQIVNKGKKREESNIVRNFEEIVRNSL